MLKTSLRLIHSILPSRGALFGSSNHLFLIWHFAYEPVVLFQLFCTAQSIDMTTTTSASLFSPYYITDQSVLSTYTRGPITNSFAPPVSCTAALTVDSANATFFGHAIAPGFGIFDAACYPPWTDPFAQTTASRNRLLDVPGLDQATTDDPWDLYYCMGHLHSTYKRQS